MIFLVIQFFSLSGRGDSSNLPPPLHPPLLFTKSFAMKHQQRVQRLVQCSNGWLWHMVQHMRWTNHEAILNIIVKRRFLEIKSASCILYQSTHSHMTNHTNYCVFKNRIRRKHKHHTIFHPCDTRSACIQGSPKIAYFFVCLNFVEYRPNLKLISLSESGENL